MGLAALALYSAALVFVTYRVAARPAAPREPCESLWLLPARRADGEMHLDNLEIITNCYMALTAFDGTYCPPDWSEWTQVFAPKTAACP
jgi:hypothetical protein